MSSLTQHSGQDLIINSSNNNSHHQQTVSDSDHHHLSSKQTVSSSKLPNPSSSSVAAPAIAAPSNLEGVISHPSPSSSPAPRKSLLSLSDEHLQIYNSFLSALSSESYKLPMDRTSFRPNADDQDDDWSKSSSPLSESERCFCSRECLLRILTATRFDLEKSITRLEQTLIWRRQYGVDQIELEIVSKESETGKQFVLGYDRQSRPCLYMFPQRQNTKPSADQIKLVVWSLERTIDLMPPGVENLSLIIDFGSNHSASSGSPTTVYQAKEVIKILQTYYCERLGKAICINVPWVFWGFYKLVKPFLDSRTAEKIEFDPVLTDLVPAEQLPKEPFGGDLDFEYDHGSYFSLLVKLTDQRRKDILERYQRFGENKIGVSEALLRGREPEVETRPSVEITPLQSPPSSSKQVWWQSPKFPETNEFPHRAEDNQVHESFSTQNGLLGGLESAAKSDQGDYSEDSVKTESTQDFSSDGVTNSNDNGFAAKPESPSASESSAITQATSTSLSEPIESFSTGLPEETQQSYNQEMPEAIEQQTYNGVSESIDITRFQIETEKNNSPENNLPLKSHSNKKTNPLRKLSMRIKRRPRRPIDENGVEGCTKGKTMMRNSTGVNQETQKLMEDEEDANVTEQSKNRRFLLNSRGGSLSRRQQITSADGRENEDRSRRRLSLPIENLILNSGGNEKNDLKVGRTEGLGSRIKKKLSIRKISEKLHFNNYRKCNV